MTTHSTFLSNPCISYFKFYLLMYLMHKHCQYLSKYKLSLIPAFTASNERQEIARILETRGKLLEDSRLERERNQV